MKSICNLPSRIARTSRTLVCAVSILALLFALAESTGRALQITELLAENDGGLRDADGDTPDWIELYNDSAFAVNLAGWHLTDQPTNLVKWTFPATNLPSSSFLVVFASGKDRAVAGAELHTSFKLDSAGGYLALVAPDGVTISQAINYPRLRANVSFGAGQQVSLTTLLGAGAAIRVRVPADDSLSSTWTARIFNDSAWLASNGPVGFVTGNVTNSILSLDVADRSQDAAPVTQAGFQPLVINSNITATATNIILIQTQATTRVYGGFSVTVSNSGSFGFDDRLRTTPANGGSFTESLLLRDVIFSTSTDTSGFDVHLAGLAPNTAHRLTVWSFDSGSTGNRISDWFANGILVTNNYTFNGASAPASNDQYRFGFDSTADANGAIVVSGRRDAASSGLGVFLNALQVSILSYIAPTGGLAGIMVSNNATAYLRIPFDVPDPAPFAAFTLRVRYNDGFIAYLNGQPFASRNAPASPAWNSAATAAHSASVTEDISFLLPPGGLVAGTNVLALQAMNVSANDPDFALSAEIIAQQVTSLGDRYFQPPSPGAFNSTGFLGLVADTKFSVDRGFYDAPFSLSITGATPGAAIYFTTNGSAPAPGNGVAFSSPISITGNSFIRAAAFLSGYVPSDIDTHSYIFLRDVLRQSNSIPGYPALWQASYPADYAMDSNIVNHPVYGATISNDLRTIATLAIVADQNGLWNSSTGIYPNPTSIGPAWERAASLELINGNGHTEFATTAKIQVHGNASRDNVRTPKHSLGVSFNGDYGPTKLRYDWFGGGVDVHDGIVLRSCGFVDGWAGRYADAALYTSTETGESFRGLRYRPENTCYLRDAWVKDSFRAMGWTASRSAYVHLYINGLYWGLYEPSEHLDASYFSQHFGGAEGAWDVLVGEDNNGPPIIADGSGNDWTNVLNVVNAGIATEAAYQSVAALVDIDNLIDYMIVHILAESEDWPRHNWFAAHRRATNGLPGTKFSFTVWDQELALDRLVRRNRIDVGNGANGTGELYSPARIYAQLRNWPEFRVRFGDRVHKHLFNDGALIPSNNVARLLASASIISNAVAGESARWGDARKTGVPAGQTGTGQTFTRDEWWKPEIDKLATNFFQKLTADNVARFRAGNLYPAMGAPSFNQFGGLVPAAFGLTMAHTNVSGVIYYTTDGTDPRAYGSGAVAGTAQSYSMPVIINTPTLVRARVFSGGSWSAVVEAIFYPPQDLSRLALTELMYHPPNVGLTNSDEFEFLELKNTGTNVLNLSGLTFSGINFTFTNGTLLGTGQFCVLVRNAAAFASKYPGVTIHGTYTAKLDNGGEEIALLHPFCAKIFGVTYDDTAPWPVTADGHGFSLVPKNPGLSQAPDNGADWRASANVGGSPGADDPTPAIPAIVINEVLTASVLPDVDRIELFNPTLSAVNIGGWFLTDDAAAPKKFRVPDGTMIPALGFAVFDETQFNPPPGTNNSFSLSSHGDEVYLFSGDAVTNLTGYSHGFSFGGAAPGITFGRYVNSVGEEQLPALIYATFSNANAGPLIGPVVFNEIHYHPAPGGDEFVELKNINPNSVPLFDPIRPTNTWRIAGLDYTFPTNVTLPPYGLLLVVATNPAAFRAKYNVPTNVPVLGPFAGNLQDSGERLELRRPDVPDTNGVSYINVDVVRYNDRAPWPPSADGAGPSLQRRNAAGYGDEPFNWIAAGPTPGAEIETADTDGDGVPDLWEMEHGTQPFIADANEDPDGDGVSNLAEFKAGTDPQSASSYLHVEQVSWEGGGLGLQFTARAQRSYSVLYKPELTSPSWIKLQDVPIGGERVVTVTDPGPAATQRFYRLVTPAEPTPP